MAIGDGKAKQYVSSDGDVVTAVFRPAKNWRALPNERPGAWDGDDNVLLHIVPDRLGLPVIVELTWREGRWVRTRTPPLTQYDVAEHVRSKGGPVHGVQVHDETGEIEKEDVWKT